MVSTLRSEHERWILDHVLTSIPMMAKQSTGCGKSTLLKALGARAVPIPRSIDIFFLSEEVEKSDTMTALEAVMTVDEERLELEKQADQLNNVLTQLAEQTEPDEETGKTPEEQQEEVMEVLNSVYERLDALDASTAEVRATTILKGLGFTHEMQQKKTKDFSGGWRMRVSLARAVSQTAWPSCERRKQKMLKFFSYVLVLAALHSTCHVAPRRTDVRVFNTFT